MLVKSEKHDLCMYMNNNLIIDKKIKEKTMNHS